MAGPVKIDVHMHMYERREHALLDKDGYHIWEYGTKPDVRYSSYVGVLEDSLQAMSEAGVAKAVVVNLFSRSLARLHAVADFPADLDEAVRQAELERIEATMGEVLKASNLWLCDLAWKHPQIIPFVTVDPWVFNSDEAASHLRAMVADHGARGVKLHPALQEFHMSDERMWPVYSACVELSIPVLAHCGPSSGGDQYAEPRAFGEVLQAFPELRLVMAHMGGGAWHQLREISEAYPNAYFDCSEIIQWTGGSAAATDRELARLILDVGAERVMMGSDFPWYDLDDTIERVMELSLLSKEEKESILGANAVRLLSL